MTLFPGLKYSATDIPGIFFDLRAPLTSATRARWNTASYILKWERSYITWEWLNGSAVVFLSKN